MQDYVRPGSLSEAIEALKTEGALPICGGTDLLVKRRMGLVDPAVLVDLSFIPALRVLREEDGEIEIGAAVPITDIIDSPLVSRKLPLLPRVLGKLGSLQIRNHASLGGNIVNASPAADSAIPLLLYDASLIIVGRDGERTILGSLARVEGEKIAEIRIAAGSVAPTPIRLRRTEGLLTGARLTPETIEKARASAHDEVSPIDDLRGSAAYRRAVIGDLVARAIREAGGL